VGVEIRIPTVFRRYTEGRPAVEVEHGKNGDVIRQIEARFPEMKGQLTTEDGELHRFVNVYLNDEDVRYLDKLDTEVSEGDSVSLLPSVAGA
jgi:molybdopterin converting factor small subunit